MIRLALKKKEEPFRGAKAVRPIEKKGGSHWKETMSQSAQEKRGGEPGSLAKEIIGRDLSKRSDGKETSGAIGRKERLRKVRKMKICPTRERKASLTFEGGIVAPRGAGEKNRSDPPA